MSRWIVDARGRATEESIERRIAELFADVRRTLDFATWAHAAARRTLRDSRVLKGWSRSQRLLPDEAASAERSA